MASTETLKTLDELYAELSSELGNAVWSFARIEWLVYEYIGSLSEDRVDELIGEINFYPRIKILKRLIDRSEASEAAKRTAVDVLVEAEKLAERRNIIVHNPWRVSADFQKKEFLSKFRKCSNQDKTVSREQLKEFTEEANNVQERLKEALDAL
jgi:hypothetical protein